MNVCIVGDGLTSLSLAKNLIKKKINVHIYQQKKVNNLPSSRTIGVAKNNLDFFKKEVLKLSKKDVWEIKKIEIYAEKLKDNKILTFENNKNKAPIGGKRIKDDKIGKFISLKLEMLIMQKDQSVS